MKIIIVASMLMTLNIEVFSQYIPPYIPQEGLIAWYPFNGNADDESGNQNHGTVTGAVLAPDRIGSPDCAYFFDKNEAQMITVASSPSMDDATNLTLTMWIKIASYGAPGYNGWNEYINKWMPGAYHYIFANNVEGLYFYYFIGGYFQSYVLPPLNQWCHLALTYHYSGNPDDDWCYFYLDGQKVDSFNTFQGLIPTNCITEIGGFNNDVLSTVDGNMDDIGIWNRALTPDEIMEVYGAYSLGMQEVIGDYPYQIYPNPIENYVVIRTDQPGISDFTLYDQLGKAIMKGNLTGGENRLNTENLPSGLYVICIDGENRHQLLKR